MAKFRQIWSNCSEPISLATFEFAHLPAQVDLQRIEWHKGQDLGLRNRNASRHTRAARSASHGFGNNNYSYDDVTGAHPLLLFNLIRLPEALPIDTTTREHSLYFVRGSIIVRLTSCLTGFDLSKAAESTQNKKEVRCRVILSLKLAFSVHKCHWITCWPKPTRLYVKK